MTSRVGPKGQVVIPKEMRDRLGIAPGDSVDFTFEDGGVRVDVVKDVPQLQGKFADMGLLEELGADHRRERDR